MTALEMLKNSRSEFGKSQTFVLHLATCLSTDMWQSLSLLPFSFHIIAYYCHSAQCTLPWCWMSHQNIFSWQVHASFWLWVVLAYVSTFKSVVLIPRAPKALGTVHVNRVWHWTATEIPYRKLFCQSSLAYCIASLVKEAAVLKEG